MAEPNDQGLRGGTQGGEASRLPGAPTGGTPAISSPSGGTHVERPSRYESRTGLADRPAGEAELLAGAKTVAQVRDYLAGVDYPANREDVIRAARRNGAPDDVLAAVAALTRPGYASFEEVVADYPRLPDRDEVETDTRG